MRYLFASILGVLLLVSAGSGQVATGDKESFRLLPKQREIALAESAAPPHVARNATIYVQTERGYDLARKGTNGFACLVLRIFPTSLEPICLDAEGTATILPRYLDEGRMKAEGFSSQEIRQRVAEGFAEGKYRAPRRAVLSYMLSCQNRVPVDSAGTQIVPYRPHIMFYLPYVTNKEVGANFQDRWLPFVADEGSPHAIVIVPVGEDAESPRCQLQTESH